MPVVQTYRRSKASGYRRHVVKWTSLSIMVYSAQCHCIGDIFNRLVLPSSIGPLKRVVPADTVSNTSTGACPHTKVRATAPPAQERRGSANTPTNRPSLGSSGGLSLGMSGNVLYPEFATYYAIDGWYRVVQYFSQ